MNEQANCPECNRPLSSDTPGGLCPACLLERGLESNTIGDAAGESNARWTPPPVAELTDSFPELDILELIGRGGMGAVYKARQKELDRLVALKILPPEIGQDESFAQRFAREAQALAKLSHPSIVTIHDFGQRGGLFFFLMEYVDGLSLRHVLNSGGVSAKEALAIVPQICDALQYAHDRGIVHRDIKPENILMNRQGQVKIADFGLAKLVGLAGTAGGGATKAPGARPGAPPEGVTQAGEKVMGTPQYMAPEQIDRPAEVDHRADIYSLGVVFYQMLTGELPAGRFEPPSHKVLIDVRLDEVVLRALEKEPARRYQQVSEVGHEVQTIVSTSNGAQQPPEENTQMEHAWGAVKVPAIGLIVAAGINLAALFALVAVFLIRVIASLGNQTHASVAIVPFLVLFAGLAADCAIFVGAMSMMRLRNRGLAITAAILALIAVPGNLIGLPMGIWALVVLSRREVVEAFEAVRAGSPSSGIKWDSLRSAIRPSLWTVAFHGVLLCLFVGAMVFVVPRFGKVFGDFDTDLPTATWYVLSLSGALQRFFCFLGLPVMLGLLATDAAACVLLHGLVGKRAHRIWSIVITLMILLSAVSCGLAMYLPLRSVVHSLDTPSGATQHPAQVAAYPWRVALSSGITVELIGVSEHPSAGKPWWRPDGKPLGQAPYARLSPGTLAQRGNVAREFAVRLTNLPQERIGSRWSTNPRGSYAVRSPVTVGGDPLPELRGLAVIVPAGQDHMTVKYGVAAGSWTTVATSGAVGSSSSSHEHVSVSFSKAIEKDGTVIVVIAHNATDQDIRVVAMDKAGTEIRTGSYSSGSAGGVNQITCTFANVSLDDIKEFRVQVRPYEWAEFRNVSVRPEAPARP